MGTVRDLLKGTLRLIGAIATGETPSADELNDALYTLNDMLDSWSNENLFVNAKVREVFSLSAGKLSFTMGPGGDFDTARPLKFENASIIASNVTDLEIPLQMMNQDQWAATIQKSLDSSIARRYYVEGTFPLETIHLWPVPQDASKLVLYTWKPLANFANLDAVITLPPGYAKALKYSLAIELAIEYGRPSDPVIGQIMLDSKEAIKRINIKPVFMDVDRGLLATSNGFNFLTGE